MNFGVNLPGPFRVGVSSSGRVNVGANVGPFSVSSGGGKAQPQIEQYEDMPVPIPFTDALTHLTENGWKITGQGDHWAMATRRLQAIHVQQTPDGISWRPITSVRKTAILIGIVASVIIGLALLCS